MITGEYKSCQQISILFRDGEVLLGVIRNAWVAIKRYNLVRCRATGQREAEIDQV